MAGLQGTSLRQGNKYSLTLRRPPEAKILPQNRAALRWLHCVVAWEVTGDRQSSWEWRHSSVVKVHCLYAESLRLNTSLGWAGKVQKYSIGKLLLVKVDGDGLMV